MPHADDANCVLTMAPVSAGQTIWTPKARTVSIIHVIFINQVI